MAELVLIDILDSVVEVLFQIFLVTLKLVMGVVLRVVRLLVLINDLNFLSLTSFYNARNLTELSVADHTISIVVTASKDRLYVFPAREETISLQVSDQVWHVNCMVPFGNRVEHSHLDEVLAG